MNANSSRLTDPVQKHALRVKARRRVWVDAVLCSAGRAERTFITDITCTGLGLSGNHQVQVGDAVSVQMANGRALDALVKWRTSDRCGLELLQPFNNAEEFRNNIIQLGNRGQLDGATGRFGFVGTSKAMSDVYSTIERAAASEAYVFITGDSGTGKELCAEAIHQLSSRRDKPFIPINCGAIPRDLFESEIFGHVKGSFTGASVDRLGAALEADGGTLFLDEIGELEPHFQVKLLRFLQTGKVKRVGEDRPRHCNTRLVCATNRDPRADVRSGHMREDLFYRLHVIPIALPSLKDRGSDILLIASHFLHDYGKKSARFATEITFSRDSEQLLMSHDWPGNVRELQNLVRCLVEFTDMPVISADLTERFLQRSSLTQVVSAPNAETGPIAPLERIIERAIDCAISRCEGSIPRAARELQVSPSTIYRHLQSRKQTASA